MGWRSDCRDDVERVGLEADVFDGLERAEDAEAPPGTVGLWAARRRRALDDVMAVLDGNRPPPAG